MSGASLVVLLGIDGAGKSTVAEHVADRLRVEQGMRVRVFWARWQPRLLSGIRSLIRTLLVRKAPYEHGKDEPKDVSNLKATVFGRWRILGVLYVLAALLDYRAQYTSRIARARRESDVLLLDRYWYDLIVDAIGNSTGAKLRAADLVRWRWRRIFPAPAVVILLDIDEQLANARKGGENPLPYLIRRRAIYREVAEVVGATTIDAGQPLPDVVRAATEVILANGSTRLA